MSKKSQNSQWKITFKKLNEEGEDLSKAVSWWKQESFETLKKAQEMQLVDDEALCEHDEDLFFTYLHDMKKLEKRINYLDVKGKNEYANLKAYESKVNDFFLEAVFGENV